MLEAQKHIDVTDAAITVAQKIDALDTSVFAIQPGEPYIDRVSFLRIQRLIRQLQPNYAYLEIGSDKGGSLLPHLLDPQCGSVLSIDARPPLQPDERGIDFHYEGNSTARMLAELARHAEPTNLEKLSTIDADASAIAYDQFSIRPHLVLIDGEHTNVAAFSDFMAIMPILAIDAIVTFHDANLVSDAIQNVERFLIQSGKTYSFVILPTCVAVFGFGQYARPVQVELGPHGLEKNTYFNSARKERQIAVADSVVLLNDRLRGQSMSDVIAWTSDLEQKITFLEAKATATATAKPRPSYITLLRKTLSKIARLFKLI